MLLRSQTSRAADLVGFVRHSSEVWERSRADGQELFRTEPAGDQAKPSMEQLDSLFILLNIELRVHERSRSFVPQGPTRVERVVARTRSLSPAEESYVLLLLADASLLRVAAWGRRSWASLAV